MTDETQTSSTPQPETQLPVAPPQTQPNPFEEEGRKAQRSIVGQLLKFTKFGTFAAGQDNIELPMGSKFLVNTDQLWKGWIRWEDGRPAEQVMGLVSEGYVPPKRDALGFGYKPGDKENTADQSAWDLLSGRPRDPWQFTYYMVMREIGPDGKVIEGNDGLYTFSAVSKGGIDAVVVFCQAFGKWFRLRPDDFPVIRLGWDHYDHPVKEYGKIKTPQFVSGYISAEDARAKKKVRLFEPAGSEGWMPKAKFGAVGDGGSTAEEIPF